MIDKFVLYLKQIFCNHIGKEMHEDQNFNICRDKTNNPYILRTCRKCSKIYKDYNIIIN